MSSLSVPASPGPCLPSGWPRPTSASPSWRPARASTGARLSSASSMRPSRRRKAPYPPTQEADHPVGYDLDHWYRQSGPDKFKSTYIKAVGGSTWHWLGTCLRFLPNDFRLQSLYRRGMDWPIGYAELEPFYPTSGNGAWGGWGFGRRSGFATLRRLPHARQSQPPIWTRFSSAPWPAPAIKCVPPPRRATPSPVKAARPAAAAPVAFPSVRSGRSTTPPFMWPGRRS